MRPRPLVHHSLERNAAPPPASRIAAFWLTCVSAAGAQEVTFQRPAPIFAAAENSHLMCSVLAGTTLIALIGFLWASWRQRTALQRISSQERGLDRQLAQVSRIAVAGRMSASLAHDLRQPIAAILLNAQGALRLMKRAELDQPDLAESLQDIVSDVSRLNKLVEGLRGLLEPGKAQEEALNLNQELEEVLDLLGGELLKCAMLVKKDLTAELPPLAWKRSELRQVIITLILNALDAMADCAKEHRLLNVQTRLHQPNSLELSIQDLGNASASVTTRRLQGFTQADTPDDMGMALACSANIVKHHQGRLEALPAPARGLILRATLPFQTALPT